MTIEVNGLVKRFGSFVAVDNVSFEVKQGELLGLLGPSGGGKSTVLRMIAGLEKPDAGEIYLDGKRIDDVPPQKRGVGMVFQHYALFKHMNVYDNIAFGLRIKKPPHNEVRTRVEELLALIGLEGLASRWPHQLSGGQRQRVALARSLAPRPKVMLLDEPFGSIDAKIRGELRSWLKKLHNDMGVTSIFVTHDQEEAFELADRINIINNGMIEQTGVPQEIYEKPATEFVANFIGPVNILPARIITGRAKVLTGNAQAELVTVSAPGYREGASVKLYVRPEDVIVSNSRGRQEGAGRVIRVVFMGEMVKMEIALDEGYVLTAHLPRYDINAKAVREGDRVNFEIAAGQVFP